MAYYIKVTQQVCKKLGHGSDRNNTADDNKLLWQADIDQVDGQNIFERAATVGGAALSPSQAKAETDGVENPIKVYTPEQYQDEVAPDMPPLEPQIPMDGNTDDMTENGDMQNPSVGIPQQDNEQPNNEDTMHTETDTPSDEAVKVETKEEEVKS